MIKRSLFSAAILGALALATVGFKGSIDSGIKVGEFVTAFHPNHLVGPHKGTDACPPCTYGKLPAVQFWVNGDDTSNVEAITKLLDHRVGNWEKSNFKAFVIFVTTPESKASTAKQIQDIAKKNGIEIAMMNVLRQEPMNSKIINAVSAAAMTPSFNTPLIAARTKID